MTVICQLNLCATVKNRPLFSNFFPKRKHKKNPCKHWVCKGFGNLFEIVKTISLITPNAQNKGILMRLSVTSQLHIHFYVSLCCLSHLFHLHMFRCCRYKKTVHSLKHRETVEHKETLAYIGLTL